MLKLKIKIKIVDVCKNLLKFVKKVIIKFIIYDKIYYLINCKKKKPFTNKNVSFD